MHFARTSLESKQKSRERAATSLTRVRNRPRIFFCKKLRAEAHFLLTICVEVARLMSMRAVRTTFIAAGECQGVQAARVRMGRHTGCRFGPHSRNSGMRHKEWRISFQE